MNKEDFYYTIWLTGISSSGKTSLAKGLYERLIKIGISNVIYIDGDEYRKKLNNLNYSSESRSSISMQKARSARKENKNGNHVIVTGISAKIKTRERNREIIGNYYEVFVKCSPHICAERDKKQIYVKAKKGDYANFPGINIEYEVSQNVDLIIDTENNPLEECTELLFNNIASLIKNNYCD